MNATLAYAAQCRCGRSFKGLVLASNTIALTLLLAPVVWFQCGSLMSRALSHSMLSDRLAAVLVPHIIAVPSEIMLFLSAVGVLLAGAAARQARRLRAQGFSSRAWSAAILFGLMCNLAGTASNLMCLLQL